MYRQIGAGIFGHTQNVGYVAKSGPVGLIFGAMGTEFQGEADYYIKLAPECDFMLIVKTYGILTENKNGRLRRQMSLYWADF